MTNTGRLKNKVSMKKILDSEAGLTLIEVLIALVILGLVGGVFASALTMSSKLIMTTQEMVAVDSLARDQMEDTKNQPYTEEATSYPQISIPSDLTGQGYSMSVLAEPLSTPDDGIQRITVTVIRNGESLFTFVDYKRSSG
jgi:prepilin-type N-terminal cleavage/methylation domain-containing protein